MIEYLLLFIIMLSLTHNKMNDHRMGTTVLSLGESVGPYSYFWEHGFMIGRIVVTTTDMDAISRLHY